MTIVKNNNGLEEPCRAERFFEGERKRRKGTRQEGETIVGNIYCGCPKCSPRY